MFDTYEDARDHDRRAHNRRVTACDEYDAADIECDCDGPTCGAQHDDCECPRDCERHDLSTCIKCGVMGKGLLQLEEPFHAACVQEWIDEGEFTAADLADFADVLAGAGVVFRAEAAE